MKRYLLMASCLVMLCGCSFAPDGKQAAESGEKLIVKQLSLGAEVAYRADSLEELYEDSGFVAEILVTEATPSFLGETKLLCTYFNAEVLTLHKGEYHGESFFTDGGCMKLLEYCAAVKPDADKKEFSADEWENGYVTMDFMGSHIPEVGERLMIFGNYSEDGKVICITSLGQSLYLCDEETVSITGSEAALGDLPDELKTDFDVQVSNSDNTMTVACGKADFIEKLVKS